MLKKFVLVAVLLMNFLTFSPAQAEIETVTGTGEYIMSMKETPEFAQQNAKLYAERAAIEQAGIFISSVSVADKFNLKKDEITTFAAGLLKNIAVIKNEMFPLTGNAAGYIKVVVTVEAQVDSDDFETALEKWQNQNGNEKSNLVDQNKSQQKLIETQTKRIKELEEKLANIHTAQDKKNVQQEIKKIDKEALYIQKIDEGWNFWNKKNFNKALEIFDEVVQLNQNNAAAYAGRGTTYSDLGQYEKAVSDLSKAIELGLNKDFVYNNRGIAYDYLQQYDAAIADFSKVIQIDPNDDYPYYNRGLSYANLKQYDAAIADYNKAIQLNPNLAQAYNNRGLAYKNLKQYEKAIADYNKAIQLNPNYAEAYNNRGNAYMDGFKQYDKAIADYNKAIQLNPNDAGAYNNRGNVYARDLKQYDAAIADYNKAIQLNPNDAGVYNNRGNTYQILKQYDAAIADYNKAIEINPNYADAYYNRGNVYARDLKQYSKAIADFTKHIEFNSKFMWAYKNRAECYQALGEKEKASADFAKARELGYKG